MNVLANSRKCRVFIGSSSEGKGHARALQHELLDDCEPILWDQGIFEVGGTTLASLISEAHKDDFAIIVATPDDNRDSRGESGPIPRDNVILEFGLFAGLLGQERTYILAVGGVRLPTDVLGITRLTYHDGHSNLRVAVTAAAQQVRERIHALGALNADSLSSATLGERGPLEDEMAELIKDAHAQGWKVKESRTTLRLTSPRGRNYAMSKSTVARTREELRPFVAQLRAGGLRVTGALRRPPEQSPF